MFLGFLEEMTSELTVGKWIGAEENQAEKVFAKVWRQSKTKHFNSTGVLAFTRGTISREVIETRSKFCRALYVILRNLVVIYRRQGSLKDSKQVM